MFPVRAWLVENVGSLFVSGVTDKMTFYVLQLSVCFTDFSQSYGIWFVEYWTVSWFCEGTVSRSENVRLGKSVTVEVSARIESAFACNSHIKASMRPAGGRRKILTQMYFHRWMSLLVQTISLTLIQWYKVSEVTVASTQVQTAVSAGGATQRRDKRISSAVERYEGSACPGRRGQGRLWMP